MTVTILPIHSYTISGVHKLSHNALAKIVWAISAKKITAAIAAAAATAPRHRPALVYLELRENSVFNGVFLNQTGGRKDRLTERNGVHAPCMQ